MGKALSLITSGKTDIAIKTILEPTLQQLKEIRKEDARKLYCSRTEAETLMYMLSAAADGGSAVVIDYAFARALFYYAYIHTTQGDYASAELKLQEALELSPSNPLFLSELGQLLQRKGKWTESLELYEQAVDATKAFSPGDSLDLEKGKALRGIGYSLVELNRLQEAKKVYLECLSIDPKDRKAKAELDYVEKMLKKRKVNKKEGDRDGGERKKQPNWW